MVVRTFDIENEATRNLIESGFLNVLMGEFPWLITWSFDGTTLALTGSDEVPNGALDLLKARLEQELALDKSLLLSARDLVEGKLVSAMTTVELKALLLLLAYKHGWIVGQETIRVDLSL